MEEMMGFGFTQLNGNYDDAELGYIYIPEIVSLQIGPFQPELDLYWDSKTTLRDVMEKCGKDTSIYGI